MLRPSLRYRIRSRHPPCTHVYEYGSPLTKIPLDIFFAVWLLLGTLTIPFADFFYDIAAVIYLLIIVLPTCLVLFTSFLADFKLRVKLGKWWQNTLIYYMCHFICKIGKRFWNFNKELFLSLPLIWKTAILVLGIWTIELFTFIVFYNEEDILLGLWFVERLILIPAILFIALMLRKLY